MHVVGFTFIGPCIVIYFYSKTNKMHQFLTFILFFSSTLHVSDDPSVHHQESKAVRTASGICQTDSADCLLAGTRWNSFFNFILFCSSALLLSDGLSVHHQESKTQFHLVSASKLLAESV